LRRLQINPSQRTPKRYIARSTPMSPSNPSALSMLRMPATLPSALARSMSPAQVVGVIGLEAVEQAGSFDNAFGLE